MRVRLARFGAITSLLCIGGDHELLPNLETHLKAFWNLIQREVPNCKGGGIYLSNTKTVVDKGRVIANRAKQRFTIVEVLAILSSVTSPLGTRVYAIPRFLPLCDLPPYLFGMVKNSEPSHKFYRATLPD